MAPLARMPRVNADDPTAQRLRFVVQKGFQLGERQGVKPTLGFAARGFDASSDVRKIFNNNSRSWQNVCQNRARKNMVTIPLELLKAACEVSQMPFGTFGTVGLQLAMQAEAAFLHLAPMS